MNGENSAYLCEQGEIFRKIRELFWFTKVVLFDIQSISTISLTQGI